MHLALAASCWCFVCLFLARACACEVHLIGTCDLDDEDHLRQKTKQNKKKLPLAGIASERARGPERGGGGVHPGGLRGFAHLGLHVGVDLRGRRRQLSACHGSPSAKTPSGSDRECLPLCSACQSSRRDARKAHLPSH